MKNSLWILSLAALVIAGCDGKTFVTNNADPANEIIIEETLADTLAGSTFVSIEPLNNSGTPATANRTVSFTIDTVTQSHANGADVGTFELLDSSGGIASFETGTIDFSINGDTIIWNSMAYQRVAESLFDSQESVTNFLEGSTFSTLDQFDIGENVSGGLAMGQWSARFDRVNILWFVQDTVLPGTYSFKDSSSFTISFGSSQITVFVINNEQLVIDSIVYQREASIKSESQEDLIAFLDGTSYRSVRQLPVGENAAGTVSSGYWYLDFLADTFSWTHSDVTQAGNYYYLHESIFNAVVANIDLQIRIEGNDIIWEGERYARQ